MIYHAARVLYQGKVHPRARGRAPRLARLYFEKFPKDLYLTEIESWRHLQSQNYEFTMKRLREPISD